MCQDKKNNTQISAAFLYISNKHTEKLICEINLDRNIKYLGIYLTKKMQELCFENFILFMREIQEHIEKIRKRKIPSHVHRQEGYSYENCHYAKDDLQIQGNINQMSTQFFTDIIKRTI